MLKIIDKLRKIKRTTNLLNLYGLEPHTTKKFNILKVSCFSKEDPFISETNLFYFIYIRRPFDEKEENS